ncbi:hypothetical protein [Pelagibaculum spongiae]|uniref:KfrA N-terminal DNA-binding domain-containing protein n=1 Tax=Pelagibaculum spongiae TaxID=2080658 RepID=A0A2V1GRY6_9GAMM|nr:hypothetical protein [Pelagibaculum spongiae]PVZ64486.1 hypothetical protein DC094_19425 [Pelagibaculum spongiae]
MGRPSVISYEDVAEAVRILQGKGKPINPYQVRSILGKGSESKILYYLKGMGLQVEYQDDDPLTKRIVNIIRPAMVELNEQYEQQIQREKADLVEQLTLEREKNKSLQSELKEIATKFENEHERAEDALGQVTELQAEVDSTQQQLVSQQQRSESLEEKLAAAVASQDDLKQQLIAAKAEHKELVILLKNEHASTVQGYKEAIQQSNSAVDQVKSQLEAAQNANKQQALEISGLKEQRFETNKEIQSFNTLVSEKDQIISSQAVEVSELSALLEAKESELQKTVEIISELEKPDMEMQKIESKNTGLIKENEKLSVELALLQKVIDKISLTFK